MKFIENFARNHPIVYRETVATSKVLSPIVLIVLLALYFNDFVLMAIEKDFAISGGIIITAVYGALIILQKLRSAQRDFRIIERFGKEALGGTPMRQLLEEPWIRDRYVRHYLKHIAETGGMLSSQLDQNAIESELHALQEDYNSKLEFPQFLVGFMIAMGLLGTFIGLLETLTGISDMLGSMSNSTASPEEQFKGLITELRKPLAGMGIAFSASMFGLIMSLMLSIMMTNLRLFISRVVMCARNVMHDLTEITRKTLPSGTGTGGPDAPARPQGGGNVLLSSKLDLLLRKLEILFKSFETSINGTTKLNELLGFGPRMKETSERSLEEMRAVAESSVEQKRILQQMADSQSLFAGTITSILETQRRSHSEVATAFKVVVERAGAIEQSNISSGKHLFGIRDNLTKFETLGSTLEAILHAVNNQAILMEAFVSQSKNDHEVMTDEMTGEGDFEIE